ncbi:MAG: methyltransferase domain-containing protein [Mojavia pulchra JT2-VF2]|jgi:2-polyprenyl-3-methyl-5-hydroxy-6-metoxy-1,4-benzoquinol methylase|uniref:Methyltransferase domain-containing protein n=1 Tax=Mojavia pulchra JT2-VF2 TaxID=287848 RepID=A0A951PV78_9NOST|nr:methyltransferase domain-containing protein [Mojavia pulchra JT2-VF2]
MPQADLEHRLHSSWNKNANAWTKAVRDGLIPSRRVATDAAILEVLMALRPRRVLDVGCGEGWLTRALVAQGIETFGVDGSPALVQHAQAAGSGRFCTLTYEAIIKEPSQLDGPYDLVVCNFSLLGETIVPLLAVLGTVLSSNGHLVVQTVHPWSACGDQAYTDGWRTESFMNFGNDTWEPMPWYFRTLNSWLTVCNQARLQVCQCIEPLDPITQHPLSLIIVSRVEAFATPDADERGAA